MKNIPKIAHFYWGGSSPMPKIMTFTLESFHKYNPTWKIIVYCSVQKDVELGSNIYTSGYKGKDYLPLVKKMSFVDIKTINVSEYGVRKNIHSILGSDIFRTNVLYHTGGLYCDLDVLWLKPVEEILNIDCIGNPSDFDASVCFHDYTDGHHSIGVMFSKAKSRFIYVWMQYQKRVREPFKYQSFGNTILNKTFRNLTFITNIVPSVLAVKYETFYPYSIFDLDRLFVDNDLTPLESKNVLAIHWFNGSTQAYDYINKNGFEKDCSMTTILKNEGYI
jgi:mannosyltransferase OCH1-like enzyme